MTENYDYFFSIYMEGRLSLTGVSTCKRKLTSLYFSKTAG